ncbi:4-aminobutyrate aminotransferase-like enzyme/Ser/Thr protein kinase RdoA (MazF antagonist) [Aurantimicrobium minutum]|uniref:aminotransferase n=1 Tax=Aurantimicrobium minutum TaxID=708131 RepID=UPI0024751DD4|nr:aminotransferase [Aurantimicrobium minutum]MDH6425252.1 4-aminobutyrate aminotransferase-like enzyme/Ser/Thr protein kinase RdoA (MazF antagonist) [Aurantimicrobium minutum]
MATEIFNYFTQTELPSPTLPDSEVVELVQKYFGVATTASSLGSQQDQNFVLRLAHSGDVLGVLKLSNPAFSEAEIQMQDEAAAHLAGKIDLRIPSIVEGEQGAMSAMWETSQGHIHARVIKFIPGTNFMGSDYLSPQAIARMGEIAGLVSTGLADFSHPASGRVLQWDLRYAEKVIDQLLSEEPDADVVSLVQRAVDVTAPIMATVGPSLPQQMGHFDITDDNIMCPDKHSVPDAVLDFGDVAKSWAVGEIATTVSCMLHHDGVSPVSVLPAIKAFHALRPLSEDEIEALWPLVIQRGAVLVLSGRQQSRIDEHNDYATSALDREMRILVQALSVPPVVMAATIRHSLGLSISSPKWAGDNVLSSVTKAEILDASTTSTLNDEGAWLSVDTLEKAALSALDNGSQLAVLPAWLPVLTGAPSRTQSSPEVIPTHATIWLAEATEISSKGAVQSQHGVLTVTVDGQSVSFSAEGISGSTLPARQAITVSTAYEGLDVPDRVTAELAVGWRSLLGDPTEALGIEMGHVADPELLLERREHVLAEVQEHYYQHPPQMERGWREYLMDTNGRVYLDMVNNVSSVGHAHPRVVKAAANQMRLLNTNSRFNYHAITEYAEMITETLPPELDTVFFVNSGSEAVDLALRLAMAYTSRPDIVCMRESYHGWTYASDAVSTSIADNPNALSTRPDWIHTVDAANSYRGIHRGEDAVKYGPEAVQVIEGIGKPIAGFISESYFGNAGGVALPDGYLKQVYAAVRAHGGLAIADEVQVGFGRLGEWFWGFHQQGVIPDIVAVAKSIGGGHPIGAVITSREIANRYRTQGYFFSSTGGSPVSSEIGKAILGIIKDEGLQENALKVGTHLKQRLQALSENYPIVGRVHGSGLYLGLEFIRDTETLEPATEETEAICNRLLELGVIMQPTGDYQNVLKIKPPLVITQESADYFVDMLEHVLKTGY